MAEMLGPLSGPGVPDQLTENLERSAITISPESDTRRALMHLAMRMISPAPNVTEIREAVTSGVHGDASSVGFRQRAIWEVQGVRFKRGNDGRRATKWSYRHYSLLLTLVIVALCQPVILGSATSAAWAQESPYLQPPAPPPSDSGTSAWFQPFEGLPVWAQAALFSAAVVVILSLVVEGSKLVWGRMRHLIYTREKR